MNEKKEYYHLTEQFTPLKKGLSVKELYELLEPLINEYGDLEVRVSYDSGLAATDIKHKEPKIVSKPMREYSYVIFEGY